MPEQIFTIGYEKRSIDEYIDILLDAGVTLVLDVRETAWSHKPGFSKTAFRLALGNSGIGYHHAPGLGNPKLLRREAKTHADCLQAFRRYLAGNRETVKDLEGLVAALTREGHKVALTCFERHHEDCHRSILAEAWKGRSRRKVTHLAPDGCRRLTPQISAS
ncbi:MAG: DUF488 domain-containing protein [Gemmatimonadales bacterium]